MLRRSPNQTPEEPKFSVSPTAENMTPEQGTLAQETWRKFRRNRQAVFGSVVLLNMVLFRGTAIFLTVLSINYIGDGLRDALDPRLS